jgi:hypothetical protein
LRSPVFYKIPLIRAGDVYEEEKHGIRFDLWTGIRVLVSVVFLYEGQDSNAGKQVIMTYGSRVAAFILQGNVLCQAGLSKRLAGSGRSSVLLQESFRRLTE